MTVIIACT